MNSTTYHTKTGNDSRSIASSTAPASVESLEAKISTLDMLRVRMASQCSFPSSGLYKAKGVTATDADADTIKGSDIDMNVLHIPTKKENDAPHSTLPTLNPESCASGHALISSGLEGNYSPTDLSKSTAAAFERSGMVMQSMRIPTKSENCEPGPTLNPASCASGLALISGGVPGAEGDGWISDLSMTALMETISNHQSNTQRQSSSQSNEDWEDLHYPQAHGNLFLSGNSNI